MFYILQTCAELTICLMCHYMYTRITFMHISMYNNSWIIVILHQNFSKTRALYFHILNFTRYNFYTISFIFFITRQLKITAAWVTTACTYALIHDACECEERGKNYQQKTRADNALFVLQMENLRNHWRDFFSSCYDSDMYLIRETRLTT